MDTQKHKSLDGKETVYIDGDRYEAFNTPGGVTMCKTFEGKIRSLSYKTIRYPDTVTRCNVC